MSRLICRRRHFLAGIGASLANPVFADRAVLDTRGGRELTCNNMQVAVSALRGRLSSPEDFDAGETCEMVKNSFEGPYFLCTNAGFGKNITAGLPGQPLTVAMRLVDPSCKPIPDAVVDLWSCGADGRYSGQNASPDVPVSGGGHKPPQNRERFGRGVLRTDVDGIVEWDTLYPGYYAGRAVHIHFKVHANGRSYLTSQAYLPEGWNQQVMTLAPYNAPRATTRVLARNERGSFPTLEVVERRGRLLAFLNIGVS